ncbi:MAG: hydantoinase B/oxoprolinase family protein [Deltaproteobacteria bacterium]|nr:MAG: hydantoinase B/oxoprolinase family protein [Deltaproteobacteria bacterium]
MDDPIELEVWRHLLTALTEEMGAVLMRSAFSPNIKERRDFSCALFDARGEMVAHAAHIPVHLGSTPLSVPAVLETLDLKEGDVALLNDPYQGGTHLPDLTMVRPVHQGGRLLGYVVNRAHHADVGGKAAGSMPIATHIDEEGVRIPPTRIVEAGRRLDAVLEDCLYRHVRTPEERRGDIDAQLAACEVGARRLVHLATHYGPETLEAACAGLHAHAERAMRAVIAALPDGLYEAQDLLDDDGLGHLDLRVAVSIRVEGDHLSVDFTGTAPQCAGPVNAVRAIAVSATLYVLRCLAPEEVPASSGLLRPVDIVTPSGTLVDARPPAPVAAGNVETSQRLVDVLFAALAKACPDRIPAASQGTMNNVAMGGRWRGQPWAYYETLAGGTGGGPGFHGTAAIHSHMTNTLNTPVEALEHAYPLRIEWLRVRRGSGGAGRYHGGDGMSRAWRFLEEAELTLITERRRHRPPGLAGGQAAAPGRNRLIHRDGEGEALPGKCTRRVRAGDLLVVDTPGGGGWGKPE